MSYAGRYRPIDPTDEPSTSSGSSSKQLRSSGSTGTGSTGTNTVSSGYELPPSGTSGSPQLPIKPYSVRPPIPTGGGTGGQSMGIGVQQGMNVLSTPVQSPFQGQPSQTETQYAPANYGQVGNSQTTPLSVPQTSSASQVSSANSSPISSNPSPAELDVIQKQTGMSQESRQVWEAFGIEAPAVLNQYALNLEGMLDSAVNWDSKQKM